MARVLIAGCGYVGSALAERLVVAGHEVWGLRRNPDRLPAGVKHFAADMSVPESLLPLPEGLDYVFYTASAADGSAAAYRAAYATGPANLIAALERQTLQRIFFTSSTGVYGQNDGTWIDETSAAQPPRPAARALLEGEARLWASGFPATVMRLSGIYGPGRTRLIDSVRDGSARCVEGRTAVLNHIHRDDCAGALAHLMALPCADALYLGTDSEPVEKCACLRWIAAALGLDAPPTVAAEDMVTPVRGGNRKYSNARLIRSGYTFRYPTYREGYTALM